MLKKNERERFTERSRLYCQFIFCIVWFMKYIKFTFLHVPKPQSNVLASDGATMFVMHVLDIFSTAFSRDSYNRDMKHVGLVISSRLVRI